jgi:hypothetical protein
MMTCAIGRLTGPDDDENSCDKNSTFGAPLHVRRCSFCLLQWPLMRLEGKCT